MKKGVWKVKDEKCQICENLFDKRRRKTCSKECARIRRNNMLSLRQKQMKEVAKDLGKCTVCYGERDNPKYLRCSECRMKSARYYACRRKNRGKKTN